MAFLILTCSAQFHARRDVMLSGTTIEPRTDGRREMELLCFESTMNLNPVAKQSYGEVGEI